MPAWKIQFHNFVVPNPSKNYFRKTKYVDTGRILELLFQVSCIFFIGIAEEVEMGLFFLSLLFPTPLHDSGSKSTKAPGRELFLLTNEVQLKGIILIVYRQQL